MKVLKMYTEGVGIRSIEKIEGIPNTTVLKWIKKYGNIIKEKLIEQANNISDNLKREDIEVLEGDENECINVCKLA